MRVGNCPINKSLNFGDDPDPGPYRDAGKTCLGGGMHCPSAPSYVMLLTALLMLFQSHGAKESFHVT